MEVYIPRSGRIFLDLIFAGLDRVPVPGEEHYSKRFDAMLGGIFNVARALTRLGVDAHLAADVGTDLPSSIVRELWNRSGVPATFRREVNRPSAAITCAYSLDHDRAFLSYADEQAPPDADPEILVRHNVRFVVLPGFPHDEGLLPTLRKARELGIPVFLDGQFTENTVDHPLVRKHILAADYFMCNELEARTLTGREDAADAAVDLSKLASRAIVKRGADGAVLTGGGTTIAQSAPKIEVVDTTGAGDCFLAGFVYAKVRGFSDRDALRYAVATGTITCTGMGGEAAPDEKALRRLVDDKSW
jgi:sugar/nucleoside kinase (ribokinase family)